MHWWEVFPMVERECNNPVIVPDAYDDFEVNIFCTSDPVFSSRSRQDIGLGLWESYGNWRPVGSAYARCIKIREFNMSGA